MMVISTLKIKHVRNNEKITLYPSIIRKGDKVFLIDCGYEESFEEFFIALKNEGLCIDQINGIFISHDDIDHLGGLKKFKEKNKSIQIFCGVLEENSISGKIKSERLIQAENLLDSMPDISKSWALDFIQSLKDIKRFEVDKTFEDGEVFENDIIIIHTPGHTRGHISFFIPEQKTLIANDALVLENGEFGLANPSFTLDLQNAINSIHKLKELKPQKVICYHGGILEMDIDSKLDKLISQYL
ncbi:MBL fold metallo-hydrolase [Shivajiella indica]|uniref:MBL fold metallo-hydrolase n=1 Tax=Shivajiella indica TaxID=872115 RepID=A0ABW5B7A1_9BACT